MSFIKNKKGQTESYDTFIRIFTTILVAGILIGGMVLLLNNITKSASLQTCRDSVIVRSNANIVIGGVKIKEKFTPLICKSEDVGVIKGTREEIKRKISKLSADCWYMYAEGTVTNIFKKDYGEKGCNICYFFQIDEVPAETPVNKPLTEKNGRPENKISKEELYNFMMITRYDPPAIRGGGTKNIISADYGLSKAHLEFEQKKYVDEVAVVDIDSVIGSGVNSFVKDYSGFVKADIMNKIDRDIGSKLLKKKNITIFVVVAETFNSLDRADARRLYENINLDLVKGEHKGILILVDIKQGLLRVVLGSDLDIYVKEFEISGIIRDAVKRKAKDSEVDVGAAVKEVASVISNRILDDKKQETYLNHGINPRSFYSYLSNGLNYPLVVDDVQSGLSYSVSYMSAIKGDAPLLKKLADFIGDHKNNMGVIWGIGYITEKGLDALAGQIYSEEGINHVLISRANTAQKYCEVLE